MGMDYVYGWDKPSCPAFVGTLGLIRALDLLLKDNENTVLLGELQDWNRAARR